MINNQELQCPIMVLRLISKQLEETLSAGLGHSPSFQEILAELSSRYGGQIVEKQCHQCKSKVLFDFSVGKITHKGKQRCINK